MNEKPAEAGLDDAREKGLFEGSEKRKERCVERWGKDGERPGNAFEKNLPTSRSALRDAAGLGVLLLAMAAGRSASAEVLLEYDFSAGLEPTVQDERIAHASPLAAVWSSEDATAGAAVARGWDADDPANYFYFTMVLKPGFALDLESIGFDYMSESASFWKGPTNGAIRLGAGHSPFQNLSGGWLAMNADGVWHRDVLIAAAGHSLTGRITVALAARGATDSIAKLSLDNLRLSGTIRWLDADAANPRIAHFETAGEVQVDGLEAGRFYTLQTSADIDGEWSTAPSAANLQTAQSQLVVPLPAEIPGREFYRMVSSGVPLPAVDLNGCWQVSSTGAYFRTGVIQFHQYPHHARYEDSMVGTVQGEDFAFGHCDGYSAGTVSDDELAAAYSSVQSDGSVVSGTFTAERYVGHEFEIWEGDVALTHSQYYDPATNGYVRIAQASSTVTVGVSRSRVLLVAVVPVQIDAFQGPGEVNLVGVDSAGGSISDLNAIYGPPDGACCAVGTGYSMKPFRGYLTFIPPDWSTLTVVVGP